MTDEPSLAPEADQDGRAAARVLAFYLPQFYPVPENDEWWGPGFTEWTNVARARPRFPGHHQPNLPGELGFYDLRLSETREAQAALAEQHGINAFCYWHYWFAGKRLLDRPFREVLEGGTPRLQFCLAWANQSWSTIWTGGRQVLMDQTYPGPRDYEAHFRAVMPAFRDPRYFRVDGRPLFLVYRPSELPDASAFADQWRTLAEREGLAGLYLVGETKGGWRSRDAGFDAEVHMPLYDVAPRPRVPGVWGARMHHLEEVVRPWPRRHPYRDLLERVPERASLPHPRLPAVLSNWDNTPRFGRRGFVLTGATPAHFGAAVRHAVDAVRDLPAEQRMVFVKSWNEWAEGNYVEPDRRYGRAYLEAVAAELRGGRRVSLIYFLAPDVARASGGVRSIYRSVDLLNASGLPAAVLHRKRGFRSTAFANTTAIAYPPLQLGASDVLVVPEECWGEKLVELAPGIRKVVFNQNAYRTFRYVRPSVASSLDHAGVVGLLVVSEDNRQYLGYAFPSLPVTRIHHWIDTGVFRPGDGAREKTISIMPRKRPHDFEQLVGMLTARRALPGWQLVVLEGRSEGEVAAALRRSALFVALGREEGFGLPVAEALASGCHVVGFHGMGGRELFQPPFADAIAEGDVRALALAVESFVAGYDARTHELAASAALGVEFVVTTYSRERATADLSEFFGPLVASTGPGVAAHIRTGDLWRRSPAERIRRSAQAAGRRISARPFRTAKRAQ